MDKFVTPITDAATATWYDMMTQPDFTVPVGSGSISDRTGTSEKAKLEG